MPSARRSVADEAQLTGKPLDELQRLADSIGVQERRISDVLCTSDLCTAAAATLLKDSATDPNEIEALVFVSQTPDYPLPATACLIQSRLGLPTACLAFDVGLGCSGFVYGLAILTGLMQSGSIRKALLLCGDTTATYGDRSARHGTQSEIPNRMLFGDAGSAALLMRDTDAGPTHFVLGTDGRGGCHLNQKVGASRRPPTPANLERTVNAEGVFRSDADLYINGPEIFNFTLREVTPLVTQTLAAAGWTLDTVDAAVMHQANTFMLRHLGKRLKLPEEKLVIEMARWGNTSSASIPLAMVCSLGERLRRGPMNLLLCGFGVGYSWAGAALRADKLTVSELVEVPDSATYGL